MGVISVTLAQLFLMFMCTAEEINIALHKPVNMSSRHDVRFPPEKGVDGITRADINSIIFTSAATTTPAWWWVDLQTQVQDATVTIYFRTDDTRERRNGVQLYTSTMFSTNPDGKLCHLFTGTNIPDVDSVNCTGTWRYLLVYKTSKTNPLDWGPVLDFGEVEVLVCSSGMYGHSCTKSCSSRQCAVTPSSCDRYNAACPPGGCMAGWVEADCTQVCQNETYGINCMEKCGHCNGTCDAVDGRCLWGCQEGYHGIRCQKILPVCAQGEEWESAVKTYVIGAVIGAFVTLAMIGGALLILITRGTLQCTKIPCSDNSDREMTVGSTQPPQSVSAHIYNNDYAVLDAHAKSENNVYDDIMAKQYANL